MERAFAIPAHADEICVLIGCEQERPWIRLQKFSELQRLPSAGHHVGSCCRRPLTSCRSSTTRRSFSRSRSMSTDDDSVSGPTGRVGFETSKLKLSERIFSTVVFHALSFSTRFVHHATQSLNSDSCRGAVFVY